MTSPQVSARNFSHTPSFPRRRESKFVAYAGKRTWIPVFAGMTVIFAGFYRNLSCVCKHFQAFMPQTARQMATLLFVIFAAATSFNNTPAHAQNKAADKKVVKYAIRAAEDGFDPARIYDRYSVGICENIFESLISYDWLARPVKLVPQVVFAVPEPEEAGTRYTFKIKPGILFADDAAFSGKKRELVAKDMEYAVKRFRDPLNRSPYEWLFENKIVGLDELAAAAKKSGKFDYDAKVEGIQLLDKYTISFKLKSPDYNFLYFFALPNVVPVAREVIEKYSVDTMAHPVGTGPYVLKEWTRRSKIVLERNPNYRGHTLETKYADANDKWDQDAIKALAGKTLPLIDRIEIYPIEEEQPRYLAFINNEHDWLEETPASFITQMLPNGKLSDAMKKRGVTFFPDAQLEITYDLFNMDDKLVGGYTADKVALRRAMVMGHDRGAEVKIVRRDQAIAAETPVPFGVIGHDPNFRTADVNYDLPRAKALLDTYGYIDRDGDGIRETPDGKPLIITYKYQANSDDNRQLAFLWAKSMTAIGIKMEVIPVQFVDLLKAKRVGQYQMASSAWIADYPDAQNFLQLVYGPNTEQSNESRYKSATYDKLYDDALALPDSEARNKLYREMYKNIVANAPWRLGVHRLFNHFINPWVLGYKKHPILFTSFKYLDIDVALQKQVMQ
jgi:oligopeptide transport system substrate-binding protein